MNPSPHLQAFVGQAQQNRSAQDPGPRVLRCRHCGREDLPLMARLLCYRCYLNLGIRALYPRLPRRRGRGRAHERAERERRITMYQEQLGVNGCLDFSASPR